MAKTATFADHIRELRKRLFLVAGVFLAASSLAYMFRDEVMTALLEPLNGQKLMYLTPAGGFTFILMVSIYAGLVMTVPFLIHQIYSFARPALPKKAQAYGGKLLLASLILLICGVSFGYFFAIPGALKFLAEFASQYIETALTADSYLNFILGYTLGLGIVFQLPLLVFITHKIHPLNPGGLLKSERWVILLSFVAAAIITPTPDPMNQTIIALPIIIIYQFGVFAVLASVRNTKRRAKRAADTASKREYAELPHIDAVIESLVAEQNQQLIPQQSQHTQQVIHSQRPHTSQPVKSLSGMTTVQKPHAVHTSAQTPTRSMQRPASRAIDPMMLRGAVRPPVHHAHTAPAPLHTHIAPQVHPTAPLAPAGRLINRQPVRPQTILPRPSRSVDGFRTVSTTR